MNKMPNKPIVYAPVPDFDQETQYVTQGEPIEQDDCIYYPCVVHDLPPQEEGNPEEMF